MHTTITPQQQHPKRELNTSNMNHILSGPENLTYLTKAFYKFMDTGVYEN